MAKKTKPRTSVFAPSRHAFIYMLINPITGKAKRAPIMAKVRMATKPVTLVLEAHHVQKAIDLGGVGNTACCAMAVCATMHADKFPHFVEGHIDWSYSRAYVVSKLDKFNHPTECVCYEHTDEIAKLNDTLAGQRKLLAMIERDGPITVTLKPYRKRAPDGQDTRENKSKAKTGARDPIKRLGKGAKLRHAYAQLSGAIA